ncbi:MAG: DUF4258 domain-containing protein [Deltaproteobacteria bacterium]|nr:DUF4258 domain-containing protein [Deltaproteobacteria bacterium]
MNIEDITDSIQHHRIRITDHADEEAYIDELTFDEVFYSVVNGEIIERYPSDKPYPSCLVYGKTFGGDHVHSVWAYNVKNQWSVLITVYRPDPDRWINYRKRRENNVTL